METIKQKPTFKEWLETSKAIKLNPEWTNEYVIKFWGRKSLYKQYLDNSNF